MVTLSGGRCTSCTNFQVSTASTPYLAAPPSLFSPSLNRWSGSWLGGWREETNYIHWWRLHACPHSRARAWRDMWSRFVACSSVSESRLRAAIPPVIRPAPRGGCREEGIRTTLKHTVLSRTGPTSGLRQVGVWWWWRGLLPARRGPWRGLSLPPCLIIHSSLSSVMHYGDRLRQQNMAWDRRDT